MLLTQNKRMEKGDLVKAKTSSSPQVQPAGHSSPNKLICLAPLLDINSHTWRCGLVAGSASPWLWTPLSPTDSLLASAIQQTYSFRRMG